MGTVIWLVVSWVLLSFLLYGMFFAYLQRSSVLRIYRWWGYSDAYSEINRRVSKDVGEDFVMSLIPALFPFVGVVLLFVFYISTPLNKRIWYGFLYRPSRLFYHKSVNHILHNAEPPEWIGKRKPDWRV